MTRGRKKDLTIPPTRTLVQQRDYRARKANYVANLEERCRKAEEENEQLRREIAQMRIRLANPAIVLPETLEVSKELMQNLALASVSLTKFQQLAFSGSDRTSLDAYPVASTSRMESEPLTNSDSSPRQSPDSDLQPTSSSYRSNSFGKKFLYTDEHIPPYLSRSQRISIAALSTPSPASSSECCGGILDCEALECDRIIEEDHEMTGVGPRSRLSGLRSTSSSDFTPAQSSVHTPHP